MPQNRPAIPAKTRRKVLTDAGHHCSACGESLTLELAHIVPFSKTGDHSEENLVCLCANCHAKADLYNWDRQTFLHYKRNPWITRHKGNVSETKAKRTDGEVWIKLNGRLTDFTTVPRDQFRYMLAGFLHIPAEDVVIEDTYEGSIVVRLRLPGEAVEKLLDAWNLRRVEVHQALSGFELISIHSEAFDADETISGTIASHLAPDLAPRKGPAAPSARPSDVNKINSIVDFLQSKQAALWPLAGSLYALGSYVSWAHSGIWGLIAHVVSGTMALGLLAWCLSLTRRLQEMRARQLLTENLAAFEMFEKLADRLEFPVFCKDDNLRFTYVNKSLERLMRLKASDLIGRTDAELVGVRFAESYREADSLVLHDRIAVSSGHVWVNDFYSEKSEKRYLQVTKVPFVLGVGRIGICTMFNDVTEKSGAWKDLLRMECVFEQNERFVRRIGKKLKPGSSPQLFIAYKHGNEAVQNWVKKLAFELTTEFKLPCILDQFDLHYGDSIDEYMRQIETKATHVILVITKELSRALQERTGMVTFEAQLAEKLHKSGKLRLIPLLRNGDVPPDCIKDIVYVDFRDDALYRDTLLQLVRSIKFIKNSRGDPPLPLSG